VRSSFTTKTNGYFFIVRTFSKGLFVIVFGYDLLHSVEGTWILMCGIIFVLILVALIVRVVWPLRPHLTSEAAPEPKVSTYNNHPVLVGEVA
jgi:hypothetical protein